MSTASELLSQIQNAMAQAEAMRYKSLRSMSKFCEQRCSVCGRKATMVNRGYGDIIIVCAHVLGRLKMLEVPMPENCTIDPLMGFRIELFEDGPRRF